VRALVSGSLNVVNKPEPVGHPVLVGYARCEKVEAQRANGKGVRVRPPLVWLLDGHRAAQADVERGQPLLPVEHRRHALVMDLAQLRAVGSIPLMIVEHKIVKLELAASCRLDFPE
jgi:hypothetical protein